ncbi:MAG TPA: sensor histidine kinase, partial [Pilimelia sp.]|nr:sensor histidine kinase [Pilimelia sp.]
MATDVSAGLAVGALVVAFGAAVYGVLRLRPRRAVATATQLATYEVLHTAGLAAEAIRAGLTPEGAARALRHLRVLTGATGLALVHAGAVLAHDGGGAHHGAQLVEAAGRA